MEQDVTSRGESFGEKGHVEKIISTPLRLEIITKSAICTEEEMKGKSKRLSVRESITTARVLILGRMVWYWAGLRFQRHHVSPSLGECITGGVREVLSSWYVRSHGLKNRSRMLKGMESNE